ncbi:MAG: TetR/AcrR family transcriptional regulator [Chloroflexi bacterium]|nr:TetR/AcrR family transcriptional regulator [Chloroflexota bacterium]
MGRREQYREQTRDEIKALARQQLADGGPMSLSLNAIARTMGVAVSGLYRYYDGRDALLTALILDAFHAHADAMEQAEAAHQPRTDYAGRLLAALIAYREWAVTYPSEFALIYGTPVPGYHAPREETVAAASRAMNVVLGVLGEAHAAGHMRDPNLAGEPVGLIDMGVSPALAEWAMMGWTRIHGVTVLDAFGHFNDMMQDRSTFYRNACMRLLREGGLLPPP